jgi:uncharacterized damage-inducible protein DinB
MPDGEIDTIREHLERFRAVTLQSLERTPTDKLHWAPLAGLMTFAGQYSHLAHIEQLYVRGLSRAEWRAEPNMIDSPAGIGELRSSLIDARATTFAWLDALALATLDDTVVVPWLPVKWTLRSWLWYLVEHELHHKGQIAIYLSMCGIEAPFFAFALPPGVRPDKRPFAAPTPPGKRP